MKRRVMQALSVCLLAGVLTLGTGAIGVLAEEEVTAETDGEGGESLIGELIFAQCDDYINIHSSADAEGEITAKIFNNGSATVVSEEKDGWLGIQSGNASGYVKADYFATGAEAEAIAKEVAYVVAAVQANEVAIRSQASTDSVVLDCANAGDELEVVEDDGDWLKVARGNDLYGYIHADYVEIKTYYPVAKTLEELEAEEEETEEEPEEESWEEEEEYEAEPEETSWYEESYEETSYEETWYEDTSYEETSYEETSYEETYETYYEDTYTETVTVETEAYAETQAYVETEAPATEAATEAAVEASSSGSSEEGVSYDSTYNGDDIYYYDANEDAYYYGSTKIETYSYMPVVEEEESAEETYSEEEIADCEEVVETVETAETTVETEETKETEAAAEEAEETESSSTTESSTVSGQDIADYATQFIGNDYVYGGTSLTDGADCSGFVQSVYADSGITVARVAADQAEGGTAVDTDDLEAGDLLFYSSDGEDIDHVAIYIGDDTIVHAANSARGIVTDYAYYDEPVAAVRYY